MERDALPEIVGERNISRWSLGEGYERYVRMNKDPTKKHPVGCFFIR